MKIDVPDEIKALVVAFGEVDWAKTTPLSDVDLVLNHAQTLKSTREAYAQEGDRELHFVAIRKLQGSQLCVTGVSPHAGHVAAILTALWNAVVAEAKKEGFGP